MRIILLIFTYLYSSGLGFAKTSNHANIISDTARRHINLLKFPEPSANIKKLIYVQRDPNTNTVIYELNSDKDGRLNNNEPVHPYWIKYAEKGQKEELNFIQRKFAYGLVTKPLNNDTFDIRFVSYKKLPLTLMKSSDGKYHIFATITQKQVILNRIFVKIEGGTFWIPNVLYVELKGTDPLTGREIVERFKP